MNTSNYTNSTFRDENKTSNSGCAVRDGEYAITIRHAKIQYADVVRALVSGGSPVINVVLKGFNMTVKKGHIYGLLGPSGCGKTSILRAIVGQLDLTEGEMRVLGHKPKTPNSGIPGTTVGYMPQDLCLLEEFTIRESLQFYGQLAGMSFVEIDAKCDFLVNLLELPKSDRIVGTLSGGQKRRLSFAVALVHSPPILILDEPTVGVDPVLRENMWEYLIKVAKADGTTILITTHYIEEASKTDIVGLMRQGKLMAEQSPQSLMQSLQCNSLEEVLLQLSILQSTKSHALTTSNGRIHLPELPTVNEGEASTATPSTGRKKISSFQRIRVLAWKDTLLLLRHKVFLFLTVFFPALCMVLFCLTYGRTPKHLTISIFNQESNCLGYIPTNIYEDKNSTNCNMPDFLSCKMIRTLQEFGISTVFSESSNSAENDVRRGWAWAAMIFSKNFTSALMKRAAYTLADDVKEDVIDMGTVQVITDQSDLIISNSLQQQMVSVLKRVLRDVDDVCHNLKHVKDVPMKFKAPIYGRNADYIDSTLPGVAASMIKMFPCAVTIATMMTEIIQGTLERGLIVGVRMSEVIVSMFIVCLMPSLAIAAESIIIPYIFFGRIMVGSFWTVAGLGIPLMASGMLLGFILALISKLLSVAFLLSAFFFLTYLLTSGTVWPLEGAFPQLQPIFWMFPLSLPSDAFRQVALRGWTMAYKSLHLALTSIGFWSLIYIAIISLLIRLRR